MQNTELDGLMASIASRLASNTCASLIIFGPDDVNVRSCQGAATAAATLEKMRSFLQVVAPGDAEPDDEAFRLRVGRASTLLFDALGTEACTTIVVGRRGHLFGLCAIGTNADEECRRVCVGIHELVRPPEAPEGDA